MRAYERAVCAAQHAVQRIRAVDSLGNRDVAAVGERTRAAGRTQSRVPTRATSAPSAAFHTINSRSVAASTRAPVASSATLARRGRQREVVLELARREIPHRDACRRRPAKWARRRRDRDGLHGDLARLRAGSGIATSSGGSSRTTASPNRSAQPPNTPVLPASRSTTVRRHTPRTPSSASCASGEPCAAWNMKVSTAFAVAARHGDRGHGSARRRQRHEQLAGRGVLHGQRQLELARRSLALDGKLARQRGVLERRERERRGARERRRPPRQPNDVRSTRRSASIDDDRRSRERHVPILGRGRRGAATARASSSRRRRARRGTQPRQDPPPAAPRRAARARIAASRCSAWARSRARRNQNSLSKRSAAASCPGSSRSRVSAAAASASVVAARLWRPSAASHKLVGALREARQAAQPAIGLLDGLRRSGRARQRLDVRDGQALRVPIAARGDGREQHGGCGQPASARRSRLEPTAPRRAL